MQPQEILGALFVLGVGFFAVLVAIVFVCAHPRISAGYLATLAVLAAGTAIAGGKSAFAGLLVGGIFFPVMAAILAGIWIAYSKHPGDDLAKLMGPRS
jgi:hypothetical protein